MVGGQVGRGVLAVFHVPGEIFDSGLRLRGVGAGTVGFHRSGVEVGK